MAQTSINDCTKVIIQDPFHFQQQWGHFQVSEEKSGFSRFNSVNLSEMHFKNLHLWRCWDTFLLKSEPFNCIKYHSNRWYWLTCILLLSTFILSTQLCNPYCFLLVVLASHRQINRIHFPIIEIKLCHIVVFSQNQKM